jgi:hypothetical protein
MNINDPTNLTHLSDLVNQYTVNKNLDLEAIEKDMIGVTVRRQPDVDPTDAFRSAMDELRQDVGITIDANMSFMDDKPGIGNGSTTTRREPTRMMSNSRSTIATTTRNQPARSRDVIEELDEIGEAETMSVSKTKPGHYDEEITNQDDFLTTLQREYSTNGGDQPDQIYTDNPQTRTRTMGPPLRQPSPPRQPGYQNTTQSYGYDTQPGYQNYGTQSGYQGYSQNQSGYQNDQGNQYYDPNRYDANNYGQGNGYPQDDRQAQLNNVMQNYGGHIDELSYKKEQEEDTKSILLRFGWSCKMIMLICREYRKLIKIVRWWTFRKFTRLCARNTSSADICRWGMRLFSPAHKGSAIFSMANAKLDRISRT